jgi:hypothetical protein
MGAWMAGPLAGACSSAHRHQPNAWDLLWAAPWDSLAEMWAVSKAAGWAALTAGSRAAS